MPISYAEGLLDVLNASTPPGVAYFQFLCCPEKGDELPFVVYMVLLHKPGKRIKAYTGSGTNAKTGGLSRLSNYNDKEHPDLSEGFGRAQQSLRVTGEMELSVVGSCQPSLEAQNVRSSGMVLTEEV